MVQNNILNEILVISAGHQGVILQAAPAWEQYGITLKIVNSSDAIDLLQLHAYLIVSILADEMNIENLLHTLSTVREVTYAPITILSFLKVEPATVCNMIELGADLYLELPTPVRLTLAYGLSLIRRYLALNLIPTLPIRIIHSSGVYLSVDERKVYVCGRKVDLQGLDFDILCLLMENKGRVLTYEQIFSRVWGDAYIDNSKDLLWQHIKLIREKIQYAPYLPNYIRTERGVGYSFDPSPTNSIGIF